jgi:transcriptional regulator with XRE-family HTH domain
VLEKPSDTKSAREPGASAFARRFARQRSLKMLTQREVASDLRVEQQSVARWEAGSSRPQRRLWPSIAEFLGISEQELRELFAHEGNGAVSVLYPVAQLEAGSSPDDHEAILQLRARELRLEFVATFLKRWKAGEEFPAETVAEALALLRDGV